MTPRRRVKMLSPEQLAHLPKDRLLAFSDKLLSLESSPEKSDWSADELQALDEAYVWFKSDARWDVGYAAVRAALAAIG